MGTVGASALLRGIPFPHLGGHHKGCAHYQRLYKNSLASVSRLNSTYLITVSHRAAHGGVLSTDGAVSSRATLHRIPLNVSRGL